MTRRLHALWDLPAAAGATGPKRRDWILVALLLVSVAIEGIARADLAWRPVAVVLAVVIVACLPWRRLHTGRCAVIAFGSIVAVQVASIAFGDGRSVGLTSSACVLVIAYATARWGSGRAIAVLILLLLGLYALGYHRDYRTVSDAVAEAAILTLSVVAGLGVRSQTTSRTRELEGVRAAEREQLARELHDVVAHHVSAMVVRAQAGRVVAAENPDAAVDALRVIEQVGSQTLAEMRVLVGTLRSDESAPRTPTAGAADIADLAGTAPGSPPVTVDLAGNLDALQPNVSAALFRIAQESVTNARKHARNATRISITVVVRDGDARLVVSDDGEAVTDRGEGYGIVGMQERAALLGGRLSAGPQTPIGWRVEAVLPTTGVAR